MGTRGKHRASNLLLGVGVVALGFCGLQLTDAWWFQRCAARSLERARADVGGKVVPPDIVSAPDSAGTSQQTEPPPEGWVGNLDVSRLQISTMIIPGDRRRSLQRGVGHISGTALPGHAGNCGIAGHRDTFFRKLRHVELGDTICITTPEMVQLYRVAWTRVVEPTTIDVLAPSDSTLLTLVTCYPFEFLGSAPQRFIVRAVATTAAGSDGPEAAFPEIEHSPERSASWHAANSVATTTTRASN